MRNPAVNTTLTREAYELLEKDANKKCISRSAQAAFIIEKFYEVPLHNNRRKIKKGD